MSSRRAVVGEDLAVAGIGRLRAEDDRRALRAAQDLVEQRQLHLAVARPAEVRAEVGGPQPALFDDLLQRGDQRLAHRIVEVVRFLDDQVDRFALGAHEVLDPLQLLRPLAGRWRNPTTCVIPSCSVSLPQPACSSAVIVSLSNPSSRSKVCVWSPGSAGRVGAAGGVFEKRGAGAAGLRRRRR